MRMHERERVFVLLNLLLLDNTSTGKDFRIRITATEGIKTTNAKQKFMKYKNKDKHQQPK